MFTKKPAALTGRAFVDPFATLGRMTSDFNRLFEGPGWPMLPGRRLTESAAWYPNLDMFERDHTLFARVDLPGMKKDDVRVEVADGRLIISGERTHDTEETKDSVYRREREYGSFYREIPLPDGAAADGAKATFEDGVLEVSVPLAVLTEAEPRVVQIEGAATPAKAAE